MIFWNSNNCRQFQTMNLISKPIYKVSSMKIRILSSSQLVIFGKRTLYHQIKQAWNWPKTYPRASQYCPEFRKPSMDCLMKNSSINSQFLVEKSMTVVAHLLQKLSLSQATLRLFSAKSVDLPTFSLKIKAKSGFHWAINKALKAQKWV